MEGSDSILGLNDDCLLALLFFLPNRDLATVDETCYKLRELSITEWRNRVPQEERGQAKGWLAERFAVIKEFVPRIIRSQIQPYEDLLLETPLNIPSSRGTLWRLSIILEQDKQHSNRIISVTVQIRSQQEYRKGVYEKDRWFFSCYHAIRGPSLSLSDPPRPFQHYAWKEHTTVGRCLAGPDDTHWLSGPYNPLFPLIEAAPVAGD